VAVALGFAYVINRHLAVYGGGDQFLQPSAEGAEQIRDDAVDVSLFQGVWFRLLGYSVVAKPTDCEPHSENDKHVNDHHKAFSFQ
jgi:hypothetical protein